MATNVEQLAGWQKFIRRFPNARHLWAVEGNGVNGALNAYGIGGKVVIIHDYSGDNGWTAYMDPFTTLDIDETFDAIAVHCGL